MGISYDEDMNGPREIHFDAGQLIWCGFPGPELHADLEETIRRGYIGALVFFQRNLPGISQFDPDETPDDATVNVEALIQLIDDLHSIDAPDPLLIGVDQEGGRVQRIRAPATIWPPMLTLAKFPEAEAQELARRVGKALGSELAKLGFDVDFAPVLDVHTNDANPVIGHRAFATTAKEVSCRALAFAAGLADAGLISCGKHFPGHGDTPTDSHLTLSTVNHNLERLQRVELAPFVDAAWAELPMIMTAHVVFSAIDPDAPATLSEKIITGLLRHKLNYEGLIVSDDLDMAAIRAKYEVGDAAIAAIRAGCDVLLACQEETTPIRIHQALVKEAESDPAFRIRLNESATRVRTLKNSHQRKSPYTILGCQYHQALAKKMAGV